MNSLPIGTPDSKSVQGEPRSVMASLHLPLVSVTTVLMTAFLLQHLASDQTGMSLIQAAAAIRNDPVLILGSGDLISTETPSPAEHSLTISHKISTSLRSTSDELFSETARSNITDDLSFSDELRQESDDLPDADDQDFQNLLKEISRTSQVAVRTEISGASVFHIHGRLTSNQDPVLPALRSLLVSLKPLLQDEFRLELTVWASSPSESAVTGAVHSASQLQLESVKLLSESPDPDEATENPAGSRGGNHGRSGDEFGARLSAAAAVWMHPDKTRPAVTVTLHRSAAAGSVSDPAH